jgi:GDP/UDP-N,N'-diacetylbacillosamine 2-epimerase (hydrolysing)
MRRVMAATGGRSEYGLLRTAIKALNSRPDLLCEVLVAGNHTEPKFGRTIQEVEQDGVPIAGVVEMTMPDDTNLSMARCVGRGLTCVAEVLAAREPEIVLLLGDRFEALAVAVAAHYLRTPIAHVHGGDVTQGGLMDDSARHAITKLSHVHLAATRQSADRILGLGEEPWRLHVVGAPGLDAMAQGDYAPRDEVCAELAWDGELPLVLGTQHPNPAEPDAAADEVTEVLEAVCDLGLPSVFTYPNQDAGHQAIIDRLHDYAERHPQLRVRPSLGHRLYAGTLAAASAVVGNSSSGLIETTLFGVPTVNVGDRQKGRERAENVIDVPCERQAIRDALDRCIGDDHFRARAKACSKPYGDGRAGERIADVIAGLSTNQSLLRKQMTY